MTPQKGAITERVKENIEKERVPRLDSFTPLISGSTAGLRYATGAKYGQSRTAPDSIQRRIYQNSKRKLHEKSGL